MAKSEKEVHGIIASNITAAVAGLLLVLVLIIPIFAFKWLRDSTYDIMNSKVQDLVIDFKEATKSKWHFIGYGPSSLKPKGKSLGRMHVWYAVTHREGRFYVGAFAALENFVYTQYPELEAGICFEAIEIPKANILAMYEDGGPSRHTELFTNKLCGSNSDTLFETEPGEQGSGFMELGIHNMLQSL